VVPGSTNTLLSSTNTSTFSGAEEAARVPELMTPFGLAKTLAKGILSAIFKPMQTPVKQRNLFYSLEFHLLRNG